MWCIIEFRWDQVRGQIEQYFIGKNRNKDTSNPTDDFLQNCWEDKEKAEQHHLKVIRRDWQNAKLYRVCKISKKWPFFVETPYDLEDFFKLKELEHRIYELEGKVGCLEFDNSRS